MTSLGLERHVVDRETYRRTVDRFRSAGILLPTFAQLTAPGTLPATTQQALAGVKPDEADPRNLFRVHWYNDGGRTGQAEVPGHVALPGQLTGVEARIVVAIGDLFPMIRPTRCSRPTAAWFRASSPAGSTRPGTGPSGRPPGTTAGAGSRSPG